MDGHQLFIQTTQEVISNAHYYINMIALSIVCFGCVTLFVVLA